MPRPNSVLCGPGRLYYGAKDDSEVLILEPEPRALHVHDQPLIYTLSLSPDP